MAERHRTFTYGQSSADGDACRDCRWQGPVGTGKAQERATAPTPERGDVSSEPTAEGLTEAERLLEVIHAEAHAAERCGKECELWHRLSRLPRHPIDAWIAARLASVQAERDAALGALDVAPEVLRLAEMSDQIGAWKARAESAEAERDGLRAALDRVKALLEAAEARDAMSLSRTFDGSSFGAWVDADALRAAVEGGRS